MNDIPQIAETEELTRITKGAVINAAGKLAVYGAAYLYLIARAKVLGPFWLGIYALAVTVASMLSMISALGFKLPLVRFVSIYKSAHADGNLKGVLLFGLRFPFYVSVALAGVLYATSRPLSIFLFHNAELLTPLRLVSLSVPFMTVASLLPGVFQGLQDMKRSAVITFLQPAVAVVTFILLIVCKQRSIEAALLSFIISYVFSAAFAFVLLVKRIPFLTRKEIKPSVNKRELFAHAMPLFLTSAVYIIFHQVDVLMLGYFRSSQDVGLYNPAASLALFISFPLMVLGERFASTIASYYHYNKHRELRYLFQVTTRLVFTLSFPLFLLMLLLPKELMNSFGFHYGQAWPVLIVLAFGQLVNAGTGAVGTMLVMSKQQKIFSATEIGTHILDFFLNILFIPRFGIMGAAVTTAISIVLLNLVRIVFVFKIFHVQPFTRQFCKPLVRGLVSYGLVVLVAVSARSLHPGLRSALTVVSFIAFYLLMGLLIPYDTEERSLLRLLRRKNRQRLQA